MTSIYKMLSHINYPHLFKSFAFMGELIYTTELSETHWHPWEIEMGTLMMDLVLELCE